MRFTTHKRRQPPAVIIISLIDILIVLLIFLMVTTTFKQQPALKLALPESKQPNPGTSEANLIVTVAKQEPHLYFGARPVTLEKLQEELRARVAGDAQVRLSIQADRDAPFGQIIKVMDAAKGAKIKSVDAVIKRAGQP
jgi:biopolymer transport protein ExbD